jgi:hypothetical protein
MTVEAHEWRGAKQSELLRSDRPLAEDDSSHRLPQNHSKQDLVRDLTQCASRRAPATTDAVEKAGYRRMRRSSRTSLQ